jgi:hypothetical protein
LDQPHALTGVGDAGVDVAAVVDVASHFADRAQDLLGRWYSWIKSIISRAKVVPR